MYLQSSEPRVIWETNVVWAPLAKAESGCLADVCGDSIPSVILESKREALGEQPECMGLPFTLKIQESPSHPCLSPPHPVSCK